MKKNENEQALDLHILKELCNDNYILITHGPAFGILDKVNDNNVGSKALLKFIQETKPIFHFFGHIYELAGVYKNSINGSYPIKREYYLLDSQEKTLKTLK